MAEVQCKTVRYDEAEFKFCLMLSCHNLTPKIIDYTRGKDGKYETQFEDFQFYCRQEGFVKDKEVITKLVERVIESGVIPSGLERSSFVIVGDGDDGIRVVCFKDFVFEKSLNQDDAKERKKKVRNTTKYMFSYPESTITMDLRWFSIFKKASDNDVAPKIKKVVYKPEKNSKGILTDYYAVTFERYPWKLGCPNGAEWAPNYVKEKTMFFEEHPEARKKLVFLVMKMHSLGIINNFINDYSIVRNDDGTDFRIFDFSDARWKSEIPDNLISEHKQNDLSSINLVTTTMSHHLHGPYNQLPNPPTHQQQQHIA